MFFSTWVYTWWSMNYKHLPSKYQRKKKPFWSLLMKVIVDQVTSQGRHSLNNAGALSPWHCWFMFITLCTAFTESVHQWMFIHSPDLLELPAWKNSSHWNKIFVHFWAYYSVGFWSVNVKEDKRSLSLSPWNTPVKQRAPLRGCIAQELNPRFLTQEVACCLERHRYASSITCCYLGSSNSFTPSLSPQKQYVIPQQ